MKRYLDFLPLVIAVAFVLLVGFSRPPEQVKQPADDLGASLDVPTVVALFETSLASAISSTATSFTLTSAADLTGTALASSTYAFIIDEGTASQELVMADCTGTSCANAVRGLSVVTGTTTVAALEHSHRRGSSVKITDGPQLNILSRIVNGVGTFPNIISYKTAPTFTNGNQIITKTYADNLIIAGGTAGSNSVPGIFFSATGLQAASSTDSATYLGQPYLYVLPSSIATDTPNVGSNTSRVVMSDLLGKIKQGWLDLTAAFTVSGAWIFNGSATFNSTVTFGGALSVSTTTTSTNFVGKQFGGTGADGALTCSSGTTTIDLGSAAIVYKNYTSISITGTCKVAFSNPANGGTIVVFKSQGDVTITSTQPGIDLQLMGGAGGAAGANDAAGGGNGNGGGGGSSMTAAGSNGTIGANTIASTPGTGTGYGSWIYSATSQTGGSGSTNCGNTTAAGGASPTLMSSGNPQQYLKLYILPGSGAAGGCAGNDGSSKQGSAGGRGAGALYMEVGGSYNFTGTINAWGATSTPPVTSVGGCGGGGGGGIIQVIYNYLTANSGSALVAGGLSGGTCTSAGGAGATGLYSAKQNLIF